MKKGFIYLGAVITISLIAVVLAGLMLSLPKNEPIACTMEAKLCPDGSAVGRTGPKCEFAQCPEVSNGRVLSDETVQIVKDFATDAAKMDQYLPDSIDSYDFSAMLLAAVNNQSTIILRNKVLGAKEDIMKVEIADAPEARAVKLASTRLCLTEVFLNSDFAKAALNNNPTQAVLVCGAPDNYPNLIDWDSTADDLTAEAQVLPYLISGQALYKTDKPKAEYYLNQLILHNQALTQVFKENWKPSELYQRILNEVEITTWQTYRNEAYGFEFKYPALGGGQRVVEVKNEHVRMINIEYWSERSGGYVTTFGFGVSENNERVSLTDWFKENIDITEALLRQSIFLSRPVPGGGEMYVQDLPIPDEHLESAGPVSYAYIMSPSRQYAFSFSSSQDHDLDLYGYGGEKLSNLMDKILSTFKFTEPTGSSSKLSPEIISGKIGPWAKSEPGKIDVIVRYDPAVVSNEVAVQELESRGAMVLFNSDYFYRVTIRISEAEVFGLADLAWVTTISPIQPPPTTD